MKRFRCGDVVPGCTATFHGLEGEVMHAVAHHARADHGLPSVPDELVARVRAALVDA